MAADNEAICLDFLRDNDRDRYLACLLSPAEKRGALAALYAFNAELARVRDLVREPLPGEVRLQYWRDLLSGEAHGETAANPVAQALMQAIESHSLPREPLMAMIDARIFDLYDDPIEDRGMLEGYAGETASALIQLAALVLDAQEAARSAELSGHAGVAQAIAGLLLSLPRHRARGQLYLPLEILKAVGLDREAFLAGEDRPRISAAIQAFAGLGLDHLAAVRRAGGIPRPVVPAFMPAASASTILSTIARKGALLLERDLRPPQWRRQLAMVALSLTRKL